MIHVRGWEQYTALILEGLYVISKHLSEGNSCPIGYEKYTLEYGKFYVRPLKFGCRAKNIYVNHNEKICVDISCPLR